MVSSSIRVFPLIFTLLGAWIVITLSSLFTAGVALNIKPVQALTYYQNGFHNKNYNLINKFLVVIFMGLSIHGFLWLTGVNADMGYFPVWVIASFLFLGGYFAWIPAAIKPLLGGLIFKQSRFLSKEAWLAKSTILANQRKTYLTCAIFIIGIMITTSFSMLLKGMDTRFKIELQEQFPTDYVLSSYKNMISTLPFELYKQVEVIPGISSVLPVSTEVPARIASDINDRVRQFYLEWGIESISPSLVFVPFERLLKLPYIQKLGGTFEPNGIILDRQSAELLGMGLGDTLNIEIQHQDTKKLWREQKQFKITGIIDGLPGHFPLLQLYLDPSQAEKLRLEVYIQKIYVNVNPALQPKVISSLEDLRYRYPDLKWLNLKQAVMEEENITKQRTFILVLVMWSLVLIGSFAVANTINSNIHEKLRDYMILRSIGLEHNGLFRMILYESLYYGLISGVLGTIGGFIFGWTLLYYTRLPLIFPLGLLLSLLTGVVMISLLAAIVPAWRLRKQEVLGGLRA